MQQEINTNEYRTILKEELAERCRQNSRYSLRAFARDINLSPSRVSEILNGKQGLSRRAAEAVADSLGYSIYEKERFCDLVASQHARSKREKQLAQARLAKYKFNTEAHQLRIDSFKAISDWYHLGILELTQVQNFQSDPRWIAKKLRISEVEVKLAIERLERLKLLTLKDGQLKLTHNEGDVLGDTPSDSIKKFHRQIMQKAQDAIYQQSFDQREYRTQILAIDRKKMKSAKRALKEFEHSFCNQMSEAGTKDSLYCLAIQFFELAEGR